VTPSFAFVILIAIIHLIVSSLFRGKKLAEQQKYEFPLIQMIELAVIAILGIMVIPDITLTYRMVMAILACIAIALFSFFYNRSKRPKAPIQPLPIKRPKRRKSSDKFSITIRKATLSTVLDLTMLSLEIIEALFFTIYFPMSSWRMVVINNIPVLTYDNLLLIAFFCLGLILIRDSWRRLKEIIGRGKPRKP
jgi:hypothetical protein